MSTSEPCTPSSAPKDQTPETDLLHQSIRRLRSLYAPLATLPSVNGAWFHANTSAISLFHSQADINRKQSRSFATTHINDAASNEYVALPAAWECMLRRAERGSRPFVCNGIRDWHTNKHTQPTTSEQCATDYTIAITTVCCDCARNRC
jgi:hypothetical protein